MPAEPPTNATSRVEHGTIHYVPVVMLLAVVAVLVGVFFAATGRGGELAHEQADHAPLDLGPVSAADVALLRPPTALWGYNMQVTDEALDRISHALRDRDAKIAYLQRQLAELSPESSQVAGAPRVPGPVPAVPNPQPLQTQSDLPAPQVSQIPQDRDDTQILRALYDSRTPRTRAEETPRDDVTQRLMALRPEAGQPRSGEGPPAEQRPADREESADPEGPAAGQDSLPWDETPGQGNHAAGGEAARDEEPGYRDHRAAGESPAGQEGAAGREDPAGREGPAGQVGRTGQEGAAGPASQEYPLGREDPAAQMGQGGAPAVGHELELDEDALGGRRSRSGE